MKLFLLAFTLGVSITAFSQVNISGDIDKGYRDLVQQTRIVLKAKELSDFASLGGEKRFVSRDWLKGSVVSVYGPVSNTDYRLNYDFLDKQLYSVFKDSVIAVDVNLIISFILETEGQSRYFKRLPEVDKDNFVESLNYDSTRKSAVEIIKQRTVTLVKGDKNSYLSNFNGEYGDNIKTKIDYYVYFPDGKFTRVKLDKKSLSAQLMGRNKETDEFFAKRKVINEGNISLLLDVVNK
jgi:hypothetical protein